MADLFGEPWARPMSSNERLLGDNDDDDDCEYLTLRKYDIYCNFV